MRIGQNKRIVVLIFLAAVIVSLLVSSSVLAQEKPKAAAQKKPVNLSKGRTLGIGAPLPIPLGAYLVYWFNDSWGVTGSGYLFGQTFSLSGSVLYKFGDNPRLDYLMQGSFGYYQTGILVSYMSVGTGVGLEYSFFKSLAITGSATVSLGFGPTVYITPGIGGGIVYYFM